MPILEKAAAKVFGNYEMPINGLMGPAVHAMTGAPFFDTIHSDVGVDEHWEYLTEKLSKNWMVTCASFDGTESD